METSIQVYTYNGQDIEFDIANQNVMINATEMAKPFGKKVENFTRLDQTKSFIKALILNPNVGLISEGINANQRLFSQKDILSTTKKSGTWMHQMLALKFAAWLSPEFEIWIYSTIIKVCYRAEREIKTAQQQRASIRNNLNQMKQKARVEYDAFNEIERLETLDRQLSYRLGKETRNQLDMFVGQLSAKNGELVI